MRAACVAACRRDGCCPQVVQLAAALQRTQSALPLPARL